MTWAVLATRPKSWIDPAQFSLLTMMNGTRTIRRIESAVRKRVNCAQDLQEDHPVSATECLTVLQTEILKRLRALDVCDFRLKMPTPSEPPQVGLRWGSALEVDEIRQHVHGSMDAEPSAPALITVRCFLCLRAILPADHLLNIDYGSIIRTRQSIR